VTKGNSESLSRSEVEIDKIVAVDFNDAIVGFNSSVSMHEAERLYVVHRQSTTPGYITQHPTSLV